MNARDFEFDLNAPITRLSDSDLLRSLTEFAKESGGEPFTTGDYDDWPEKILLTGEGFFFRLHSIGVGIM